MPRETSAVADTMSDSRHPHMLPSLRLDDLKLRIDTSAYVVDPQLLAEAVLRRGGLQALAFPLSPGGARSPSAPADPARRGI